MEENKISETQGFAVVNNSTDKGKNSKKSNDFKGKLPFVGTNG